MSRPPVPLAGLLAGLAVVAAGAGASPVLDAATLRPEEHAYRLGALAAQIERQVPGTLLASRWVAPWESDEPAGGVLTFGGAVPPAAAELAVRSGLPVTLVAADAPDQDRAIVISEALIELLEAQGLGDGMWAGFELSRSAFVVYSPGAVPSAAQLERVSHLAGGYPVIALPASPAVAE